MRGFAIIAHVFAPHIWKLGSMDSLERLKQRQEAHAKLLRKENNEILPLFIHSVFVSGLLYYEFFRNIGGEFTFEVLGTLAFIYVFYSFFVMVFTNQVAKTYAVRCVILTVCHGVCFYLWIWGQDKWSVAYFVGLLFVAAQVVLFSKFCAPRGK